MIGLWDCSSWLEVGKWAWSEGAGPRGCDLEVCISLPGCSLECVHFLDAQQKQLSSAQALPPLELANYGLKTRAKINLSFKFECQVSYLSDERSD